MSGKRHLRVLTHSEMSTYRDCNRRWWIRYVLGYKRRSTPYALWYGTVIHLALEAYWLARKLSRSHLGTAEHMAAGLATVPQDIDPFELARIRIVLLAYAAAWNPIRCTVLHVELSFRLPLINPATGEASEVFERSGKIDLVLGFANGCVLVEHKTTSEDVSIESAYRRRTRLDEQLSIYTLALDNLGLPVRKIVYDVLRKIDVKPLRATPEDKLVMKKDGTPRKGQRTEDETLEAYQERLVQEVLNNREEYVVQFSAPRLQHEREEFKKDLWAQAELMRVSLENGYAPKNSRACLRYHGAPCDFLDVCEGTASLQDASKFEKLEDVHPELGQHTGE